MLSDAVLRVPGTYTAWELSKQSILDVTKTALLLCAADVVMTWPRMVLQDFSRGHGSSIPECRELHGSPQMISYHADCTTLSCNGQLSAAPL